MGRDGFTFGVIYPIFPMSTTASPTLRPRSPEGGSGEYVVPRDVAEPREFPSLNGQLPKEVPVGPKAALLTTVSYTMLGISSLS